MLTIFSTPKPFRGHSGIIQRNALKSWTLLHPDVEVILFGNEEGAAEVCRELGIRHEPEVRRNENGTKCLHATFERAGEISCHYANCDIMLTPDFCEAVEVDVEGPPGDPDDRAALGYRHPEPWSIDFDMAPEPNHSRAVRLDFGGGTNLQLSAPFQYVPVEPGRSYHFRAYLRTSEITTESGVHFEITDPNHGGAVNVLTEDFTGTRPWTAVEAEVTTGPETRFLLVRLARVPSRLFENKLSGTAWMADVSLVPASPAGERAPQ